MRTSGMNALTRVMGRLAITYNVKDRRAAEVSAIVVRLAQGDASPLKDFALRLGIGKRDVPFFAAVSLLFHASLAVEAIRLWARERGYEAIAVWALQNGCPPP